MVFVGQQITGDDLFLQTGNNKCIYVGTPLIYAVFHKEQYWIPYYFLWILEACKMFSKSVIHNFADDT